MRDPASFIAPAYLNVGESLVREFSKLMSVPGMVSLAGGYPGPERFDCDGVREAADAALCDAIARLHT
jgi:2-aminoadipate transaminase